MAEHQNVAWHMLCRYQVSSAWDGGMGMSDLLFTRAAPWHARPHTHLTLRCSAKGEVVGSTMRFCTSPMRTMRGGRSSSGAAVKR